MAWHKRQLVRVLLEFGVILYICYVLGTIQIYCFFIENAIGKFHFDGIGYRFLCLVPATMCLRIVEDDLMRPLLWSRL